MFTPPRNRAAHDAVAVAVRHRALLDYADECERASDAAAGPALAAIWYAEAVAARAAALGLERENA